MSRLRVDWPSCEGRGLCWEAAPELIALDPWGFPVVPRELTPDQVTDARAATRVCPKLALHLSA